MKNKWKLGLLALAVLCSGCSLRNETAPSGSSAPRSSVVESEPGGQTRPSPINGMAAALREADGSVTRIDTAGTQDGRRRLSITRQLLDETATLLEEAGWQPVDSPIVNGAEEILLQISDPFCAVQLFRNDTTTLLWLQVGEQYSQYAAPPEVYDQLALLLEQNTVETSGSLTGETLLLQPAGSAVPPWQSGFTIREMLELNDTILLWYELGSGDERTGAIELFDTARGKSIYYEEFPQAPDSVEASVWQGNDFRLLFPDGTVQYRSTATPGSFYADTAATDPGRPFTRYDSRPEYGLTAWAVSEGILLAEGREQPRLILFNEEIDESVIGPGYHIGEEFPELAARYGSPHILAGGKYVVAEVLLPASQSGYGAIAVYNLETGDAAYFNGIFSAMLGGVAYINDVTVAALSLTADTVIDLNTLQAATFPHPPEEESIQQLTSDYQRFLYCKRSRTPDGGSLMVVYTGSPDAPLISLQGDGGYLAGISAQYGLILAPQGNSWELHLFRY